MKVKLIIIALLLLSVAACSKKDAKFLQKDYFLEEKGVVVASCPSNISLKVDEFTCVTPCKLSFPDDTGLIRLEYKDQVGYVQTGASGYHGYELQGTIMILNADLIGVYSDSPQAPVFLRDTGMGLSNFCGVQGTLY